MPVPRHLVVIGGSSGLGRAVAAHYAGQGYRVTITGRDDARTKAAADDLGARPVTVDLAQLETIADALIDIAEVDHLVLAATGRDHNSVPGFDAKSALALVTTKLVGYTEVAHALAPRLAQRASIVLFGGLAKDRPYPGSTTVSTINAGVTGLANTMAIELAPIRVNSIHPGPVADSPHWLALPQVTGQIASQTPTGRLATTDDVTNAVAFLLENESINGIHLIIDGGLHFH
jgi:NAD(P)-dependent dehydrogenase (short-subunit alcohol dehydrogenase family)